jgi:hypothetical protein
LYATWSAILFAVAINMTISGSLGRQYMPIRSLAKDIFTLAMFLRLYHVQQGNTAVTNVLALATLGGAT